MELSPQHLRELKSAKSMLERPSLATRLVAAIGSPLEKGFALLPDRWAATIGEASTAALTRALDFSIRSLRRSSSRRAGSQLHRLAVAATGAAGGAFGMGGLLVELPVSTTIMLRSIAGIASEEGEDLDRPEGRLACIEVFAFGGPSRHDDAAETGYFAVRAALASSVTEAARYIAQRGAIDRGAPALARFISAVASRFGVVLSEKAAAMAVPAIGAAGGALVNSVFISHFQTMARGHFTVRRLERLYDEESVKNAYQAIVLD